MKAAIAILVCVVFFAIPAVGSSWLFCPRDAQCQATPAWFSCSSCRRQYERCKRDARQKRGTSRDNHMVRCDKRYQKCTSDCR